MNRKAACGFSLVELSIVLVIIGTLASAFVVPLSSSYRHARYKQTQLQLQSIREAMHGFLVSAGHLPCPIAPELNAPIGDRSNLCTRSHGGVPAAALGVMGERNTDGALLDSWGRPIFYAVSMADSQQFGISGSPDWLSVGELSKVGASNLNADLQLCKDAAVNECSQRNLIADQIVWVIYSLGELDAEDGIQIENQDNDRVFSVTAYSSNTEKPFDDQIIWASRSELVYWLLKANWLP